MKLSTPTVQFICRATACDVTIQKIPVATCAMQKSLNQIIGTEAGCGGGRKHDGTVMPKRFFYCFLHSTYSTYKVYLRMQHSQQLLLDQSLAAIFPCYRLEISLETNGLQQRCHIHCSGTFRTCNRSKLASLVAMPTELHTTRLYLYCYMLINKKDVPCSRAMHDPSCARLHALTVPPCGSFRLTI